MSPLDKFGREKAANIQAQGADQGLKDLALAFMRETGKYQYTYNFSWMGVPVIQFPQDLFAVAEIIFETRPDIIIETGVAHGGGLIFYASMLELLGGEGKVIGVDVALRDHNRSVIKSHPMARRIRLVDGSSIAPGVIGKVSELVGRSSRVLVILDSDHTHHHVLRELELYSPFVRVGGYVVVFDTTIEDQPAGYFGDKPWTKSNNPKTAVREFLQTNNRFEIDHDIEAKLLITVAREGFLRCIKDPPKPSEAVL
jgi:cephalosporin hydroxylase